MHNTDHDFLRRAIELGLEGMRKGQGGPFGAVVVKDGQIVGKGWNRVTSSSDPTAHAEVTAIRDACRNLKDFQLTGCVLYTSCEPCPMCLGAIYWARPDRFVFAAGREDAAAAGFDDQFIYDELPMPPANRSLPGEQMLSEEGAAMFERWRDKEDKVEY